MQVRVGQYQFSLNRLLLVGAVLACAAGAGVLSVFFFQVYFGDDAHLKKSTILARINEETSIYYLDEETRIGSFFNEQHRRYVPIDEIPPHMINALVASEDKYFYDHGGINPIAILKAIAEGLKLTITSGFTQIHFRGGSTITQQTVKNILDQREYSISRKFREAIAAVQIERLYSKRQIIEFYLNQFHVASNGNGVGIAARYYFDKDVRDLDLVEAAFIAGSVKGPSKYNPFIKYTPEDRKRAWRFANQRKNYVLKRMYEQSWISEEEFRVAWEKPVPFNKGKFTSHEVALVSLIRSQLNKPEILSSLNMESIEELDRAGLKIFTTLDADIQNKAQLMMRRNLSRLETILQGFKTEPEDRFKPLRDLEVGGFYYAKVERVVKRSGKPTLLLDMGLPKGEVPYSSLVRYAKLMDIAVPRGYTSRLKELLNSVKVGDVVFVEVREYDEQTHVATLELQKRPLINGAVVVLDKGEMRAVVSGFDPSGYNRAIFGKRQPGSVFKSVAYFAGLQLGWSILDRMDNERRLFPYQGQFYYPRPDHASPYQDVSMLWSGIKSENLASIYLVSHLIDKLNFEQFKGLLGMMGFQPEEGEKDRDFHYRVARAVGVQVDNEGIKEYELANAINDLGPDLVFSGDQSLLNEMSKMWWGRGYAAELQRLYVADAEELSENEKAIRISLVKNNYQRHAILAGYLAQDWQKIATSINQQDPEAVFRDEDLKITLARFRVISGKGNRPSLGYFRDLASEEPKETTNQQVQLRSLPGRALNLLDVRSVWGQAGLFNSSANISLPDVKLSGFLPLQLFRKIQDRLDERYRAVLGIQEPYDLVRYFHHHDFRVAIGLLYVKRLCEQMGVFSKIEPVLSLPLGTNVVSVAEVAKVYQTFIEGKTFQFYKEGPANQLNFIRRIEDRFGNVLYEPQKREHQLVAPEYAEQMRQILRKVVTHGTGRRAHSELYLKLPQLDKKAKNIAIRIPAYGKTGTTNDYMTASFAGFVPYPVQKQAPLDPKNSYVLASYVGYDFNRQMRRGGFKVSGFHGALPVWTDLAKSIIEEKKYVDSLDLLDLKILARKEWPLKIPPNTAALKVDLPRGVIFQQDTGQDIEQGAMTDYEVTGEEFINEFALNSSIKSTVRIPTEPNSRLLAPLRMVHPFSAYIDDEEDGQEGILSVQEGVSLPSFPSKVEPNASSKIPGLTDASAGSSPSPEFRNQPIPPQDQSSPNRPDGWNSTDKAETLIPKAGSQKSSTDQLYKKIQDNQQKKRLKPEEGGNDGPGYKEEELW